MAMRITTKGIGAHDQDLELRRLNLLVGPNGSGKSKLAEAVRMVALGYVPALGKRPVDLAALMHGDTMSVELGLEGGRTIRRTLERRDTGYTAAAEASWMRQGKPGEISKAITKMFGDEEQDVAECLDIRQLLAATPNVRVARVEQLLASSQRSADEIADAVARLWIMRLADTTEDRMPAEYMKAFEMIPQPQQPVVREVAPMLYGKIKESGITGALTWANAEKRDASEGLKRKSAAADELRKRAAQVPEPDERDIMRLEGEKAKKLQELGAVRQRWTDYKARAENLGRLQEQLAALESMADRTAQIAADAEAVHGKQIKELREKSDQVLEQMGGLKMPAEEDDGAAKQLEADAAALAKRYEAIELPNVPDCSKAEARVEGLEREIRSAEASPWSEVLNLASSIWARVSDKRLKIAASDKAVLKDETGKLSKLARNGMGADLDEVKHSLDLARKQLTEQIEASDKATAARQLAATSRQEISRQAEQKRAEAIQLRAQLSQRRKKALADFDARRTELSMERQKLEKALETQKGALESVRGEKASVDRRLASVQDQVRGAGEAPEKPEDPSALEFALSQIGEELAKLIAARATHSEIHQVLDAIEAAKASAVVYTAIEWALQRQREIEISNAGGPLIKSMADFLKAAGRKEEAYIRASQGSCAIGWKTADGREVQVQALSGGEWVLFAAALTAAVILCRKSALKILLVEAGETDGKTLQQLLAGIRGVDASEQLISIVMCQRPPESIDEAWSMVRIYEDKEAATAAA